ncbi:MAG TPA: helix-turn-helix domain-containing protein [Spirochaetota bacterium]|nr:helix-turn-helix domain-containing protein [Spirochaetota bacterium]HPI88942.1 helix-turn-helix domain-containing protein [Spirochaetota bacterium]HPR46581.1 helix-turn-helix domain-containing protein [Spirochaetota bacterium]
MVLQTGTSLLTVNHIPYLIILFSGFFAWMLALGQITLKERQIKNYILITMLVSTGILQINAAFHFMCPESPCYRVSSVLSIPSCFSLGPLIYFYFQHLIYRDYRFKRKYIYHFIPGIAATVAVLFLSNKLYQWEYLHFEKLYGVAAFIILHAAMVLVFLYCLIVCYKLCVLYRQMQPRRKNIIRPGLVLIVTSIIVYILWTFHAVFHKGILEITYLFISAIIFGLYLIGNRYPEYLYILRLEASRLGYSRSQIKDIDVPAIVQSIKELFDCEKIYCDEEISLKGLADELSITPHQLSEILNEHLNKNFYQFINEFRIQDSQEMLIQDPARSIVSVATAVGFNSPSAFYTAFKKITGQTPSQYRKKADKT